MKILTYLFYNLYSWYYKDGNYNKKITPWFQATASLAIGFMLWIFLFTTIYYNYILNSSKVNIPTPIFLIFAVFIYTIIYFLFVKDNKYERIFIEYNYLDRNKKVMDRFIAIMFILFPGVLILLFSLI